MDPLPGTDCPPLLHYYNPYYLRLDLKTHSTRLLHNSIQQTSVDVTPERHQTAAVVYGLTEAGTMSPSLRDDRRSCSIVSAGKKTVAFADTVVVCDDDDDDDYEYDDNDGDNNSGPTIVATKMVVAPRSAAAKNVLQVHSQTGEVVGDVLIERKRDPPSPLPSMSASTTTTATTMTTPSPVDDDDDDDSTTDGGCNRRKRHELFCRRRQSPVYSCDDGSGDGNSAASSSSSSVYESCEEQLPVVVLAGGDRPPLRRSSAAAVNGYASCCPL